MRLPAALVPLRHKVFRLLWTANVVTALGTWMQNTGAGWLMTSLAPDPLSVALVQAAAIVPTFLLALPAGAIADIVDRRRFMIGVQVWMMLSAVVLVLLTYTRAIDATGLIALTFAIGMGTAMYQPPWAATLPEVVPRHDLVQAIALNGIGFNIARALGPAVGGVLLLFGGPTLTFLLFALSFLAGISSLVAWKRRRRRGGLPPEHFVAAVRAGVQFVRHTPAMQAAIVRAMAYFLPAAAPWAMLPLVVREQLGLGAGSFGLLLGLMGAGGVTSGMLLPRMRVHASRSSIVLYSGLLSAAGMLCIGATRHWAFAALGMYLFGIGWVTSSSTTQAAALLVAPAWVRARALAIYQLWWNGALALGLMVWGILSEYIGLQQSMVAAAALGAVLALVVRRYGLDDSAVAAAPAATMPQPEAPAPELAARLPRSRGRILEMIAYRVAPGERARFLAAMQHVQHVRGRGGAVDWHLYEDVAHPEGWIEVWCMQNWTDHLREAVRLSDEDRRVLAAVRGFHKADCPAPARYLAVDPRNARVAQRDPVGGVGRAFRT